MVARTTNHIEPCPVCGRIPKVIFDGDAELFCNVSFCTVRCRRFLFKHLEADAYGDTREDAFAIAVDRWNTAVTGRKFVIEGEFREN